MFAKCSLSDLQMLKRHPKVSLSDEDMRGIVGLMVRNLAARLRERTLELTLTDAALDYIVKNGSDPQFGARPLKRFIAQNVETMLARKILADDPEPYSVLRVDADENHMAGPRRRKR